MTWNICICDDETTVRNSIKAHLTRFSNETGESLDISEFCCAEDLLSDFKPNTDILFLDIRMDRMSGMEAARKLRQNGYDSFIFFITSITQYALEGYEVHAFAFLRKPVKYSLLKMHLSESLEILKRRMGIRLELKTLNGSKIINSNKVSFFEAYGHEVTAHIADGDATRCCIPLSSLEDRLATEPFFRCHKSYLVNLRSVAEIQNDRIFMDTGDELPLSRHRRNEFLKAFATFIRRQSQ